MSLPGIPDAPTKVVRTRGQLRAIEIYIAYMQEHYGITLMVTDVVATAMMVLEDKTNSIKGEGQ